MKNDLSPLLEVVESLGKMRYNFTPNCLVVYPNNPDGFSITVILNERGSCLMYFDLLQMELSVQHATQCLRHALEGNIRLKVLKIKNQIVEWNLENCVDSKWTHMTKMDFMYWYSVKNARVSYLKNTMEGFSEGEWDQLDKFNYSYSHIFIA